MLAPRQEIENLNEVVAANKLVFEDIIDKKFLFEQATQGFEYVRSGQGGH
jgi:hypothetical protein